MKYIEKIWQVKPGSPFYFQVDKKIDTSCISLAAVSNLGYGMNDMER
jgi:hypothetical protein